MSREEVKTLLTALKSGIDAVAVGVFDVRRGDLHASSELTPAAFWDVFGASGCWDVDWGDWDRELLESKRALVTCGCGRHSVEAFLIHERWALLVLAVGSPIGYAESVVSQAVKILARLLPTQAKRSAGSPFGGGRGGGSGSAAVGIPVWWVRRRTEVH